MKFLAGFRTQDRKIEKSEPESPSLQAKPLAVRLTSDTISAQVSNHSSPRVSTEIESRERTEEQDDDNGFSTVRETSMVWEVVGPREK